MKRSDTYSIIICRRHNKVHAFHGYYDTIGEIEEVFGNYCPLAYKDYKLDEDPDCIFHQTIEAWLFVETSKQSGKTFGLLDFSNGFLENYKEKINISIVDQYLNNNK